MKLRFERAFLRDVERLDSKAKKRVKKVLGDLEQANSLREVEGCKKLKGWRLYYRVRIGDYRLGVKDLGGGEIAVLRVLHRREIYRRFP